MTQTRTFLVFSDLSDGEITCKLYLAEENVKAVTEMDCSDVSDVSSAILDDSDDICGGNDENIDDHSVDYSLCCSVLVDGLQAMTVHTYCNPLMLRRLMM